MSNILLEAFDEHIEDRKPTDVHTQEWSHQLTAARDVIEFIGDDDRYDNLDNHASRAICWSSERIYGVMRWNVRTVLYDWWTLLTNVQRSKASQLGFDPTQ